MAAGYIYVMTSKSWRSGVFKVGLSGDPERRARELYTTGLPHPVKILKTARVGNMGAAEKEAHTRMTKLKMHEGKEFFRGSLDAILQIFDDVASKHTDELYAQKKEAQELANKREVYSSARRALVTSVEEAVNSILRKEAERHPEAMALCRDANAKLSVWKKLSHFSKYYYFLLVLLVAACATFYYFERYGLVLGTLALLLTAGQVHSVMDSRKSEAAKRYSEYIDSYVAGIRSGCISCLFDIEEPYMAGEEIEVDEHPYAKMLEAEYLERLGPRP